MSDGGKGSAPRPVDQQKFSDNFDRIFKREMPTLRTDKETIQRTEQETPCLVQADAGRTDR